MKRRTSAETATRALLLRERREVRERFARMAQDNAANRKLKRQRFLERVTAAFGTDPTRWP